MNATAGLKVIVGLGDTGLACARFLARQNTAFAVTDSRMQPPQLQRFKQEFPAATLALGAFSTKLLHAATEIIISPGVSLQQPEIASQVERGKSVIGDIELMARHVNRPLLAITGTNGKTTVTSLLGLMLQQAGLSVTVCGNIGEPVLNYLDLPQPDYYVIELSSFQLETTYSLKPTAATILNISPDHMDRYANLQEYVDAKRRIYRHCHRAVVNADEPMLWQGLSFAKSPLRFSVTEQRADFSLVQHNSTRYLARYGEPLIACHELRLSTNYHVQNALAALALAEVIELPLASRLAVVRNFAGLPHRCQWIRKYNGVNWYNDSKGTNVGAARAAITSLGARCDGKLVLIAGGQGKGADFLPLQEPVKRYVKQAILLGEDAMQLERALAEVIAVTHVDSMAQAVELAARIARSGDDVLLSPACASLDMFTGFAQRGDTFTQAVNAL